MPDRESRRRADPSPWEQGLSPYEAILQESLSAEFRVANTGLPQRRKLLSTLLSEDRPQVACNDGGVQSFKRVELEYLASLLDAAERGVLLLPIMIQLPGEGAAAAVLCGGQVEEKVISAVLGMPAPCVEGRIRLYRPQLAVVRRKLRTTTQYVFAQRSLLGSHD
ncbi:MAG: DUF61 family protein [Chloroflexota bacterium]